ncbi:hypothetical protein Y032_0434g1392 [Ancylostoma ceylanicum]|uniref:Uncharacterized protein n=1 Tax=Ancylostoma ceylanicum TaxID=53326 RepID=A0A016WZI6_9BILA|nr:hypothetical protein Y032_0434g1392 [Ancylostoma ceylanicum]
MKNFIDWIKKTEAWNRLQENLEQKGFQTDLLSMKMSRKSLRDRVRFSNLNLRCAVNDDANDDGVEEDDSRHSETRSTASIPARPAVDIRKKLGEQAPVPPKRRRGQFLEKGFECLEETSRLMRERWDRIYINRSVILLERH